MTVLHLLNAKPTKFFCQSHSFRQRSLSAKFKAGKLPMRTIYLLRLYLNFIILPNYINIAERCQLKIIFIQ